MTEAERNARIVDGFHRIYPNRSIALTEDVEDEIVISVGDQIYMIELTSDDDGFFYAYPLLDPVCGIDHTCIRIAYPD